MPILEAKYYKQPSVFKPKNLLREARRQLGVSLGSVPNFVVLDPDGENLILPRSTIKCPLVDVGSKVLVNPKASHVRYDPSGCKSSLKPRLRICPNENRIGTLPSSTISNCVSVGGSVGN